LPDLLRCLSAWGLQDAGGIDYQPDPVLRYISAAPTRTHTGGQAWAVITNKECLQSSSFIQMDLLTKKTQTK